MTYKKKYEQLRKKYTDEEIIDAAFVPEDLTAKKQAVLAQEMKKIRMRKLLKTTDKDKIIAGIMQLRFEIESYLKNEKFSLKKTFGKYLEEYIRILRKSRKEIAFDLNFHYTKLSRVINDKEAPNIELAYRLEKHSGNLIRAELWWKLLIKKQEFMISQDQETRNIEQKKVKNPLILP